MLSYFCSKCVIFFIVLISTAFVNVIQLYLFYGGSCPPLLLIVSSLKLISVNYFWSRFRVCFIREKVHLLLPRTKGHYLPRTTWHWIFTWPHKNNWIFMLKLSEGQIVVRKTPSHHYHHILLRPKAKKGKSTHFYGDEMSSPPPQSPQFIICWECCLLASQLFGVDLTSLFDQVLLFVLSLTYTESF